MDGATGLLRASGHDRPALSGIPAALRRNSRGHGPVLVEARKNGARLPGPTGTTSRCRPRSTWPRLTSAIPSAATTATSPLTAWPPSYSPPPSGLRICPISRCTSPAWVWAPRSPAHAGALALDDIMGVGGRRPAACGSRAVWVPVTWTCPRCMTGSHRSCISGSSASASAPRGRPTASFWTATSTATRPGAIPALSGGGALGNGRMHGVPQMLECYLQLSGRAGERQRPSAHVGVACHSSPHFGGAVVYTNQPF